MPFVIGNSVVSGGYLENRATPATPALAERWIPDEAAAPAPWELEPANVLRTACLRERPTAQHAQETLHCIELPALALRFGLSSYDAACLELALRCQLPLATQDEALRSAALAAGAGRLAIDA